MTAADAAPTGKAFKDHFSGHSRSYAEYRPSYPDALFGYLADCCYGGGLAWDCATGNGQAARALTTYFDRVIATDASEAQIRAARSHPKIEFRVAPAEQSGLADRTADLITVAQALHWFDLEAFTGEARRVLAPGGVLACWCYARCIVDTACDALITELYRDIVGAYWLPERKLVEEGYRGIELPFEPINAPLFSMTTDWTVAEMLGYLRTWSSSQRYLRDNGVDPVSLIEQRLVGAWGAGRRPVSWPLHFKIGRA